MTPAERAGLGDIRSLVEVNLRLGPEGGEWVRSMSSKEVRQAEAALALIDRILDLPRGYCLVAVTRFEAEQLTDAAGNSLGDPDYQKDHMTPAGFNAASRLSGRLDVVTRGKQSPGDPYNQP